MKSIIKKSAAKRKKNGITIPLFDIIALGAGAYVGYNDAVGNDMNLTAQYITLVAPTVLAVTTSYVMQKGANALSGSLARFTRKRIDHGDFHYSSKKGEEPVPIRQLPFDEQNEAMEQTSRGVQKLEDAVEEQSKIIKHNIGKLAVKIPIETFAGYMAPIIYFQMFQ